MGDGHKKAFHETEPMFNAPAVQDFKQTCVAGVFCCAKKFFTRCFCRWNVERKGCDDMRHRDDAGADFLILPLQTRLRKVGFDNVIQLYRGKNTAAGPCLGPTAAAGPASDVGRVDLPYPADG